MMGSEYRSPGKDLLVSASMAQSSGFGGSQAGSDYGFGTPQSINLDAFMLGGGQHDGSMSTYRSAPSQNFAGGFDLGIRPSPTQQPGTAGVQRQASMTSLQDDVATVIGQSHRLSVGSTSGYAGYERQNSLSDTTSPGAQMRSTLGDELQPGTSNGNASNQSHNAEDNGKGDASLPPTWSELKTKAGKDRKRLPLACIACRRKKIRCSGEKPSCKHCLRSRIPCVYKVTTRKAAPRTDYMAMLDKRLKRMEERVIKIIPKEEQGIVNNTGRAQVRPPLPPPPPKPANSKKRGAEQAFGDELDKWANPGTGLEEEKTASVEGEIETMKEHNAEEHNLLQEGADKLPSKEIQEHLAEIFFDYVYGQSYHLLHKPSFMRKLAQGTVPPVLMLAVCAISARFSNHPAVRTDPVFLRGEDWARVARDISLRRYDTPSITILIVYLLLGLHEFGTCQGGRSWMFGGMAQRMAYALQLHKDLDHDPKLRRGSDGKGQGELTFTDREIRRRTMWSCFLMDRFNSSGTDRPIFVTEQYIVAQLPIKESYYQMEISGPTEDLNGNVPNPVESGTGQLANARENMGVAAYLVRLVAIWGQLIHYLNLGGKDRDQQPMWAEESMFQSIKRAAEQWKNALPDSLQYTPDNLQNHSSEKLANQFLFLHIVYNQIILFMNRFALPTPGARSVFPQEMPTEFIRASSLAASDAANQVSALVHEAMDHSLVAPFAGYCAYYSSTVHIHGAFSKNAQLEASSKQNLAWNVKYLTKMKKYWGMFHFMTENLRDLYRRHADFARSDAGQAKASPADADASIFQYGDWFDRYPHGVSGTDYEEPSIEVKKEPGADAVLGQKSDLQSVEEFFSKLPPPNRNTQPQQPQPPPPKRVAKKRRASKPEGKLSAEAAAANSNQKMQQGMQPNSKQSLQQAQPVDQQMATLMANPGFHGMPALRGPSSAFPQGFQPPSNSLGLNAPAHLMSQLDRQMVLNSYAGVDMSASSQAQQQQAFQSLDSGSLPTQNTTQNPDIFGLDAFSQHNMNATNDKSQSSNGGGSGFWGDPSTAWFMPFNMEPPSIGDDHNLFNSTSGFDWAGFGGVGDMTGMPPTGLTPGPVEMDQQDESNVLEGFDAAI